MARGPATFRQRDLTAAVKAVKAAGCDVGRVEIDAASGRIIIVAVDAIGKTSVTDLDVWMASHARAPQGS